VVDTLENPYLQHSTTTSASVVETAATKKTTIYSCLLFNGSGNTWPHECQHSGVSGADLKAFD